jgi:hypothetical protein
VRLQDEESHPYRLRCHLGLVQMGHGSGIGAVVEQATRATPWTTSWRNSSRFWPTSACREAVPVFLRAPKVLKVIIVVAPSSRIQTLEECPPRHMPVLFDPFREPLASGLELLACGAPHDAGHAVPIWCPEKLAS